MACNVQCLPAELLIHIGQLVKAPRICHHCRKNQRSIDEYVSDIDDRKEEQNASAMSIDDSAEVHDANRHA